MIWVVEPLMFRFLKSRRVYLKSNQPMVIPILEVKILIWFFWNTFVKNLKKM